MVILTEMFEIARQMPRQAAPVANHTIFGDRGDDGERHASPARTKYPATTFAALSCPCGSVVHCFLLSRRIAL